MHISSPFLVVPVIVFTFLACILWATGGKAEGEQHEEAGSHPTH